MPNGIKQASITLAEARQLVVNLELLQQNFGLEDDPDQVGVELLVAVDESLSYAKRIVEDLTSDDPDKRPKVILSMVDNEHPHGGFVLGWDTCGACNKMIRRCMCVDGPSQPGYVNAWKPKVLGASAAPLTDEEREKYLRPKTAPVVQDVVTVPEPAAVGRKKRADAGVPRGPRSKKDTTEAASALVSAIKKGSP